jgi:hypothetical protein
MTKNTSEIAVISEISTSTSNGPVLYYTLYSYDHQRGPNASNTMYCCMRVQFVRHSMLQVKYVCEKCCMTHKAGCESPIAQQLNRRL